MMKKLTCLQSGVGEFALGECKMGFLFEKMCVFVEGGEKVRGGRRSSYRTKEKRGHDWKREEMEERK
jgi:hypothetical protein